VHELLEAGAALPIPSKLAYFWISASALLWQNIASLLFLLSLLLPSNQQS
jgi:hypothetical protein